MQNGVGALDVDWWEHLKHELDWWERLKHELDWWESARCRMVQKHLMQTGMGELRAECCDSPMKNLIVWKRFMQNGV